MEILIDIYPMHPGTLWRPSELTQVPQSKTKYTAGTHRDRTIRTTFGLNANRVPFVTLDDLADVHRPCRSGWSRVEGGSSGWTVLLEKRPARLSEVLRLFVCSCFQGTRVSPVHSCIPCMGHQDQWRTAGKALYCTRYRRIVHRLCKCFILHLFLVQKRTPCSCSRTTLCGSALQKRCPDIS